MSSLNKATIIGRLGDNPDVRYTQSNIAVANMSIATSEKYKDKSGEWVENTEWHRVVLWDRLAEIAQEYLKKGSQVYIEGPLQTRKWEDKQGNDRWTTEIKGLKLIMLGSKDSATNQDRGAALYDNKKNKPVNSGVDLNEDFEDIDDDLPF